MAAFSLVSVAALVVATTAVVVVVSTAVTVATGLLREVDRVFGRGVLVDVLVRTGAVSALVVVDILVDSDAFTPPPGAPEEDPVDALVTDAFLVILGVEIGSFGFEGVPFALFVLLEKIAGSTTRGSRGCFS